MIVWRRGLLALVGGGVFGAAASVANHFGGPRPAEAEALWQPLIRAVSLVLGAGWAWAALCVIAGSVVASTVSGRARYGSAVAAGALAPCAGDVTYYAADAALRVEVVSGGELVYWLAVAAVVGPVMGLVGAAALRRDALGLVGRLVVPLGAALQMIVSPPGIVRSQVGEIPSATEAQVMRVLVLLAAVALAAQAVRLHSSARTAG